jgi:fatty acid-binding protein DegV
MVKLITDSTNDLNKELLDELDIEVIPLYVNFGVESYKDGIDITTEELYKKVEERVNYLKQVLYLLQILLLYSKNMLI